jgi:CBS domain-containing protein
LNNDPSKIPVKNLMTKDVAMVEPETTVKEAGIMMDKGKIGSLVIMENDEPIGIITERDFAIKIVAKNLGTETKITKVMSSPVIHILPDESVVNAADIMEKKKIRKIPVFGNGRVTGIITATDLIRFFRFLSIEEIKGRCPLHTDEQLVTTELTDGTKRLYCSKCERFFALDE